jgi:hypothetical protein
MPFAQPNLGASAGDRVGATFLAGALAPMSSTTGSLTRLAADIGALPPFGVIGTTVSAGFSAGTPPRGASMLTVSLAGVATTSRAVIQTLGGYCRAHAELSITIEEWAPRLARQGGRVPPPRLVNRVTFSPTKIFDDWGVVISYQLRIDDGTTFTSVAGMPVDGLLAARERRSFVCWINLFQSAETQAVSGYALAVSNVQFDFPPVFFAFL